MKAKFCLIVMIFVFLTGCATQEPTRVEVVLPSVTISIPTSTGTSTPTLEPTATPEPTETMTPTITSTPSPTPIAGGGKIAFWGSDDAGDIKFYLTDIEGKDRKVIFDPKEYDFGSTKLSHYQRNYMEWSPNGNYLKFYVVDFKNAQFYLYVYDHVSEKVTFLASQKYIIYSYWSLDGRYIFYNLDGKLYVVDVEKNLDTVQIDYPEKAAFPIGLMKDDQIYILQTNLENTNTAIYMTSGKISFVDQNGGFQSADVDSFEGLYTINLDSQVQQAVEFNDEMKSILLGLWGKFYFIGTDIYFQSCQKNGGTSETCSLYSYNVESNQLNQIISFENQLIWDLSFSPNGKQMWMGIGALPGKTGTGGNEKILDLATLETLIEFTDLGNVQYNDPTWSPDGNYVIFVQLKVVNMYAQGSTLGRLNMLTGEITTIVDDFLGISLPAWSP